MHTKLLAIAIFPVAALACFAGVFAGCIGDASNAGSSVPDGAAPRGDAAADTSLGATDGAAGGDTGSVDATASLDAGADTGDDPGPFVVGVKDGVLYRVSLAPTGKDTALGQVTFDGGALTRIHGLTRVNGQLVGLDFRQGTGQGLVLIDEATRVARPAPFDLGRVLPGKAALGTQATVAGTFVWGSDQFGPARRVNVDSGVAEQFGVRQNNSVTDPTQCHTPEDAVGVGQDIVFAGVCFGQSDASTYGGVLWRLIPSATSSDKEVIAYKRDAGPNMGRILGLTYRDGRYWASSENSGLMVADPGGNFARVRTMSVSLDDLE